MSQIEGQALPSADTGSDEIRRNVIPEMSAWKNWLWVIPWLLLSLILTICLPPVFVKNSSLDLSYLFCIHYALLHHFRFGIDYLGSFGPVGIAYNSIYQPQLVGWMFAAQIVVGLGMFTGIWTIARNMRLHPLVAGLWIVVLSIWATMAFDDGRMIAMCLLPMLIRRTNPQRRDSIASYAVLFAMAVAGFCKFTFLSVGVGAIGLLSLEDLIHKRVPKLGIAFVAMVLLVWCGMGQALSDLPAYVINTAKLADGYTAAMGLPDADFFMLPTVAAISAMIALLVLLRFWRNDRFGAVVAFLTTAGTLFVCFKEGFLRHDGHEIIATIGVAIIAFIFAPVLWVRWYPRVPLPAVILVRLLLLGIIGSSIWCMNNVVIRWFGRQNSTFWILYKTSPIPQRPAALYHWIHDGEKTLDGPYQAGMDTIRAACPLPALKGTTDMYGTDQLALIAAGMDYLPRPVSPGFQAWTPELIDMNRRSLLGDRAPENIFFMPESIDNRFPSLEDGALWPHLMSRYTPVDWTPTGYLVMRRLAHPVSFTLTPLTSATFRLGNRIPAPQISSGALWMTIKLKSTLAGKVEKFLLRSREVYMNVRQSDGHVTQYRIIPGMTEDGFILSPQVKDAWDFFKLMTHRIQGSNVSDVIIWSPRGRLLKNFYDLDVEVSFQRLEVPVASFTDGPNLESKWNLIEMARSSDFPLRIFTFTAPDGKIAMLAYPPMHMKLAVPSYASQIHIACGIQPAAWEKTKGVIFIISALKPDGSSREVFRKPFQPQTEAADRRELEADIRLPAGSSNLSFETQSVSETGYCWSYWSDIRFK